MLQNYFNLVNELLNHMSIGWLHEFAKRDSQQLHAKVSELKNKCKKCLKTER